MMRKKPILSCRSYSIETIATTIMVLMIGKTEVSAIITNDTKNKLTTAFVEDIRRFLENECEIDMKEQMIRKVAVESVSGFIK